MIAAIVITCILLIIALVVIFILTKRNKRLVRLIKYHQQKIKETSKKKQWENKHNSDMLQRMIPTELFEFLQIRDISNMSFETQRQMEIVSIHINHSNFSSIIHSKKAEEVFAFINQFMDRAIPMVYKEGGIIEAFQEAGINVIFLNEYERSVAVAVSIMEILNELAEKESAYNDFSIGLCYDNSIVGIVGHPERMSLLTLSAYTSGLSKWLQTIGGKYYARILATNSCMEKIRDFQKKFNVRFLGYIYIKDTNSMQKIYDVFDGDKQEIRNCKRQTKIAFEKGVNLYLEQNYQEARQYFIEVLKTDRFDKAAKEYIYLCESYLKDSKMKKRAYIEYYG